MKFTYLSDYRKAVLGITAEDLAEKNDVAAITLRHVEMGHWHSFKKTRARWAAFYGLPLAEFERMVKAAQKRSRGGNNGTSIKRRKTGTSPAA